MTLENTRPRAIGDGAGAINQTMLWIQAALRAGWRGAATSESGSRSLA